MSIATPARDGDAVPLGRAIEAAFRESEADSQPDLPGIPTGFHDFDVLTGGLQSGHLIVVAGRPSVGKSMLANNLARSCSIKHGRPSVIFTVGKGASETAIRILSAEARVALHHIRGGALSGEEQARIDSRSAALSEAPLFIVDSSNLTFADVEDRCRRLRSTHSIDLVIIDFINGLAAEVEPLDVDDNPSESYVDWEVLEPSEISTFTASLKNLARELEIPIVAVVRLDSLAEGQTEKRLYLDHLPEADSLAQHADVLVLLHRDDLSDPESPRIGEADLIVAKLRRGVPRVVTVAFQGAYARFVDMAPN